MFLTSPLFMGITSQKVSRSQSGASIPAATAKAPSSRLSELKDHVHLHSQSPRFGSNPPSIAESTSSDRHNRLMKIFKNPNSPLGRLLIYKGVDPMNDGDHHWDLYHLSESLNQEKEWNNKPFTWKGIYRWLHKAWPPADK